MRESDTILNALGGVGLVRALTAALACLSGWCGVIDTVRGHALELNATNGARLRALAQLTFGVHERIATGEVAAVGQAAPVGALKHRRRLGGGRCLCKGGHSAGGASHGGLGRRRRRRLAEVDSIGVWVIFADPPENIVGVDGWELDGDGLSLAHVLGITANERGNDQNSSDHVHR